MFVGAMVVIAVSVGAAFVVCLSLMASEVTQTVRYDDMCAVGDTCTLSVTVDEPAFSGVPVYAGYQLTKYYQNYKDYYPSYSDEQLDGRSFTVEDLYSDCYPQDPCPTNGSDSDVSECLDPCGIVYATRFNDTFSMAYGASATDGMAWVGKAEGDAVDWTSDGVAWAEDPEDRFNPSLIEALGDEAEPTMAWMRASGTPSFVKPYRIIEGGLEAGEYTLTVGSEYPVDAFGGTKAFVLTTRDPTRPSIVALCIGCLVSLGLAAPLALLCTVTHIIKPRSSKYTMPISAMASVNDTSDVREVVPPGDVDSASSRQPESAPPLAAPVSEGGTGTGDTRHSC
ncbi:CDC50/LEM3 family protein [Kipferlia bialata]|uniref:CDC50/LEM3 family protein n=1 Tax=Kipferlia bialata TaxID=797122 RepID=A0A9K3CXV4_9EUKA|nr:CDC50/LEM3 family protein [Kipferlia bialata]|eukprot:g5895.t1